MFVTSPALMNAAIFSGPYSHWGCSAKALQNLRITIEALAVIANLGEQARSDLGSRSRQRAKQIMIGMTGKELFDSLTVHSQLFIHRKEHLYQAQSQQTFSVGGGLSTGKFASVSEDLHTPGALITAPKADGCGGIFAIDAFRPEQAPLE